MADNPGTVELSELGAGGGDFKIREFVSKTTVAAHVQGLTVPVSGSV